MSIGLLVFLIISTISLGQVDDDLAFILINNPIGTKTEKESLNFSFNEVSEFKLAIMGFIRLYQLFISSQDKSVCNFTFSCSHSGISAFQKYGVFHGLLMASDRIQRCHGLGRKYYLIDSNTGLAIDYPIDSYYLGKKKNKLLKYNSKLKSEPPVIER